MGNTKGKLSKDIEKKALMVFQLIDKNNSGEIEKKEALTFW